MDQYLELILQIPQQEQELWIAKLYALNFENFVEEEESLSAFIANDLWTPQFQEEVLSEINLAGIEYRIQTHEPKDWNAIWESSFDPIMIQGKLYVRASFHPQISKTDHEIIISPKMAFGTGHHSTTSMILEWMVNQDLKDLDVLDFGCGTGILGIYAKKKGCKSLILIDNDENAIENTIEHCEINNVQADAILLGSVEQIPDQFFDLILANITRNVLEECLGELSSRLATGSKIVMSGFLESDLDFMKSILIQHSLEFREVMQDKDWIAIYATKK
ncbi:MAG: 50S ribosomal protein L11 methyltransferase [Saprospiraceae bacterium]